MFHHKIVNYVLLFIGVAFFGCVILKVIEQKEPLNQFDAFVFPNNGKIHYFELHRQKGKVEGKLHELTTIEESGKPPFIDKEEYPLTGKIIDKKYEFKVNISGEDTMFDAYFIGPHLSVRKQGEKERISYNPVDQKELESYVDALLVYHEEEREKKRRKKFFDEFKSIYGYMYFSEDSSYQLLLKIDEALQHGGEITGSLLMMTVTGNKNKPYEETKFLLNGITDGKIIELFTTVDGKETKLKGKFQESASRFDLSYWKTNDKIEFQEVTEEEFKRIYEEFKTKSYRL